MITNKIIIEQLDRISRNHKAAPKDIIEKFSIKDELLKRKIEILAKKYEGRIPESETNCLGVTPRHVQITFDGLYMVIAGQ